MSKRLEGFVLGSEQGLIHKDTGLYDIIFTTKIREARLFNSRHEADTFKTLRGLDLMSLTCYQIRQQTQ
jgi:hypothetical protein